jgi:hypothetical protein
MICCLFYKTVVSRLPSAQPFFVYATKAFQLSLLLFHSEPSIISLGFFSVIKLIFAVPGTQDARTRRVVRRGIDSHVAAEVLLSEKLAWLLGSVERGLDGVETSSISPPPLGAS